MSAITSKAKIVLPLFGMIVVWLLYYMDNRRREIHEFFANKQDLEWAQEFVDKKTDFCDVSWLPSKPELTSKDHIEFSPSGRYRLAADDSDETNGGFIVFDQSDNRQILRSPHEFAMVEVKWVADERYLVYKKNVYADDDWHSPTLYIADTRNGKSMYFSKALRTNCADDS